METRNLSSHTDMHTHAGSSLHNPVTLTFDILTSGSMHAEVLPYSIGLCVPSLVLIAEAVFLLKHRHTDTKRRTHKVTDHTTHTSATSGMANNKYMSQISNIDLYCCHRSFCSFSRRLQNSIAFFNFEQSCL